MEREQLIKKLSDLYPNGKISCTQARKFAQEHQVELAKMGELCNEAGIKICSCQLGCF